MSLSVNIKENKEIEILEEGVYPARVVCVLDLGTQAVNFQNESKLVPQVMYTFELGTENIEVNGELKPRWLSRTYNLSKDGSISNKSNFFKDVIKALGNVDNLGKHINKPCMVTVINNKKNNKVYNNISAISGVPKGLVVPELVNDPIVYEFGDKIPEKLPDYIKDKIEDSVDNDDFPF